MCTNPRTSAIVTTSLNVAILLIVCIFLYMTVGNGDAVLNILLPHLWAWVIYSTISFFAHIFGLYAVVRRSVKSMGYFCYYSIVDLIYYFSVSIATCVYLLHNLPVQLVDYCEKVNNLIARTNNAMETPKQNCKEFRGQFMALGYTALCLTVLYFLLKLTFLWSYRRYRKHQMRLSEENEKWQPQIAA